jgi:peptide deformylase
MIHEIVQFGHPVLRQKCREIEVVDEEIRQLASDMLETMVDANGVGLAAPQIGRDIRLAVVDVSHDPDCISYLRVNGEEADLESIMPLVFINPQLEFGKDHEFELEGCLSIEGIRAEVRRPADVRATLPQLDGTLLVVETDGLLARAIQHETDHLNGILFTDRLNTASKVTVKNRLKRLMEDNGYRPFA